MRRANARVLLAVFCAFLFLCAWFHFDGRFEEFVPLSPVASIADAPLEAGGYLIDVNAASAATLTTLPGIGETLAMRIVEYRGQNGPFETLEDLSRVSGIGEGKLEAIRRFLIAG